MGVIVVANSNKCSLDISDGNNTISIPMSQAVVGTNNATSSVYIAWGDGGNGANPSYVSYPASFYSGLGSTPNAIQAAIAALLVPASGGGGGGTIGGSIASPQVAYGSGVNTITGDVTFTFDSTNKVVQTNGVQLSGTPPVTPVNGDIWFDSGAGQLRAMVGGVVYSISLSPTT